MRKIIIVLLWTLAPAAAFAVAVPEPETLSLLGIGALAFITSRLIKK